MNLDTLFEEGPSEEMSDQGLREDMHAAISRERKDLPGQEGTSQFILRKGRNEEYL